MSMRTTAIPTAKKLVYELALTKGIVSKSELMDQLALTSSSLTRLLEEMTAEGLLQEGGRGDSTGGRRPILYRLNARYGYVWGLEISRLYSSLGLFDLHMNPLRLTRWRMDASMTPERLVAHVEAEVRAGMEEQGIRTAQILGMGIGAVGPLDQRTGRLLSPLFFPAGGYADLPIRDLLEQRLGFPCMLENGANTALIGEHWMLRGEDVRHMLYVHAGAGLRSAMMSNGRIVYGAIDPEGAIGQMIVQVDGPRLQENGNYGALEAFASVQALEKRARTQLRSGSGALALPDSRPPAPDAVSYDTLLEALRRDDPFARELFAQSASYLGVGLANLINILHPERVILGGALIASHEMFFETATRVAGQNIYYSSDYRPSFSKGELKEDAVATGAAVMVLRNLKV
ncbi:ROK family protein [Cohnella nanjingensis]|uniref:ROK family protein n=1 Tax=Cohnella nanjingensis TaxID=1387779 RepID=A0A7X0RP55_9BACL|nr:ROK family protein [Cohnella nanjingensis]MBB6671084.1 ROK family protein [Cohnella nanjingensis]